MADNQSRYYVAELEERLATLAELRNDEFMTSAMFAQIVAITLVLPLVALLIGWFTL